MAEVYRRKRIVNGEMVRSSKWTIRYYDPDGKRHTVTGYRDKEASETCNGSA